MYTKNLGILLYQSTQYHFDYFNYKIGDKYIGCFKSGEVYTDFGNHWFEADHYRFG